MYLKMRNQAIGFSKFKRIKLEASQGWIFFECSNIVLNYKYLFERWFSFSKLQRVVFSQSQEGKNQEKKKLYDQVLYEIFIGSLLFFIPQIRKIKYV